MNDFLIKLQAILDGEKSKGNINKSIDRMQHQLDKLKVQAEIDPKTILNLTKQIEKIINQKITISNINIDNGQIIKNAQKTGQQMGQVISDSAQKAISNVSSNSIGKYFKIDSSTSNQFKNEMEKLVKEWTNAKGKLTDVNIQTRTSYDEKEARNIERLHQATVTYKNELDEVIKKTIAWRQIGTKTNDDGEEVALRGFVEVAGQYSKSLDTVNAKTDSFVEKQQKAVASAQSTLSTIESKLNDPNISKSLSGTDFNANGLNTQLERVKSAISVLGSASKDTFTQAQIDVNKEITSLNNLISTLKNAEYAATSLRTKDINTVKIDEGNNLNAFVQKMEQSGHYTDELKQKVENLRTQLNGVFDANTLTSYLNGLSNLQSEFKSVDATAKTLEKSTKLQTNIDAEKKILQVYTNELKTAGVLTDDVKEKIQNMFHSLSKVDSQNGLTTWRAELKGVKAETDAVLKSVTQLSQKKLDEIQLLLDNGHGVSQYQNRINSIIASLERYGVETKEAQNITYSLQSTFDSMKGLSGQELVTQADKLEQEFKAVKASVDQAKLSYDKFMQPVSNEKATSLINRINSFLTKNTKITNDAKVSLQGYADELSRGVNLSRWNEINGKLKETENSMRGLGKLGASFRNQMSQAVSSFSMWLSASTLVMKFISQTREAVNELKSVNTYLTEISKTNHSLSQSDLEQIGNRSFNVASKYGKTATDYLSAVQDMSRAGYQNAEAMAEVSTAAQGAGDMTAEVANKMVIATDKAYKLGGSVEKLTEILDGVNWICDNNAVNMSELSEGMSIVGSTAASLGVNVNELTAALGTMASTTQQSGSEVARAFKAILLNIRQISDEEEGIDAEGLTKYEKACNALGVSLKETKDGILQTRDAMKVLKELSEEYNKLDANDIRRTDLLNSVGGKLRSTQLDALLRQWDTYENMLKQFSEGSGTMAAEAEKTAKSWEGSLKRLHNTWVDTVGNIVNSDFFITITNGFNGLLSVINTVTSKLDSLGTIGLGAGLFAGVKNFGKVRECVPFNFCFEYALSG